MVLRTSEALNAPGYKPGGVLQSSVGSSRPDLAKFAEGPSTADRILQSVVQFGAPLAEKAFDKGLEEEYLKGVEAAAIGQSEEELQTNLITSDWTKAGYRDTQGRLAMAKQQAEIETDMPSLAQGTPEDFAKYMAEKREPLLKQLNGMSRQQRAAQFGQMATDQATATKKYTAARAGYIMAQEEASIQASMSARRLAMDSAKGDLEVYNAEVNGFTGAIYKDIWSNPKLTTARKIDMTKQAAEFAASSDNVAVHAAMSSTRFIFPDGRTGTLLEQLPFKDQIDVDKAQRAAMGRVKVERSAEFETAVAVAEAEWADPNVGPTESYEQVKARLDTARTAGVLGAGKTESHLQAYFKAVARNKENFQAATAYSAGDAGELHRLGVSQEDGLKATLKALQRVPAPQAVQTLMAIGNTTGQVNAFEAAGAKLGPAIAQLGMSDEIDPTNAELVSTTASQLTLAEKTNTGAYSNFMKALSTEQQDMFVYTREAQAAGITDPLAAVKFARGKVLADKQQGGVRTAAIQAAYKEDAKAVAEIDDRGLFSSISSAAAGWVSADAKTKTEMSADGLNRWFENTDRAADVRATVQQEYGAELARVSKSNPYMGASGRQSKALASLSNRILDTDSGPLIMPYGQNINTYFGVPAIADKALVAKAVTEMHVPAEGNRMSWSITADNKLMYRELSADGKDIGGGFLNPKDVTPKVNELLNKEAADANAQFGAGVTRTVGSASVTYNGENSAGVSEKDMLQIRNDLIDAEGITNKAYEDGGGTSFGVGIHSGNTYTQQPAGQDGNYTPAQINESFSLASNDAAKQAARSMGNAGVSGPKFMRFFAEMAYQSPGSARDPKLLAAISVGDKTEAIRALRETNAFKNSPTTRQATYLTKLNSAME